MHVVVRPFAFFYRRSTFRDLPRCVFRDSLSLGRPMSTVNRAVEEGFVKEKARKFLVERDNAKDCVRWLTDYDLGRNPGRFQIKRGG